MFRTILFGILGFPLFLIILMLMSLRGVNKYIVLATMMLVFGGYIYIVAKQLKKTDKAAKEKAAEYSKKASAHLFKAKLGFFPEDLYERRNEKEVLLKLSFIAKKLDKYAKARSISDNVLNRTLYSEFLARYQDCIDSLAKHHPAFAAKLPHWTEIPTFVDQWERQNNSTNGNRPSKMACQN